MINFLLLLIENTNEQRFEELLIDVFGFGPEALALKDEEKNYEWMKMETCIQNKKFNAKS